MKRFMDRVWELMNDEKTKHFVPMYDELTPKGVSYEQIRDISGRVYAYLKARNIGKEDFVMIQLPRGVQPVIAMTGIWRAGAALVIAEENMPPERVDYIYKDCGCKLRINSKVWEEILCCEPLDGYEQTDPHDAAFATYTSGTTGNPKGVLHEYGNIDRCIASAKYRGEELFADGEKFALAAPINFTGPLLLVFYCLYRGSCAMYIMAFTTAKNPVALVNFLISNRITETFLTPTHARRFVGKTGPYLKKMIVGTEPANHLYIDGLQTYNLFGQSESAFLIAVFVIDKEYDVTPVGVPQFDLKYRIVDDNGNDVPVGEIGELVVESPYTRGYINLPEESAKVFRNGFVYTTDLFKALPDGNLIVCGKKTDMIKINGNRIEPAEIEAAIRSVLKIDWCAVRGFVSNEHSYICAYYLDDISFDVDELRTQLQKRLPYYMIPAHFIKIDTIPTNPNGKMIRNALPEPEIKNIVRSYKAPSNEVEAILCKAMEKVLKMERVGIDDDFYQMGGDSLSTMEVLIESALPGLDVGCIFRGRTAAKIAGLYMEQIENRDPDMDKALNETSKLEEHRLTTEQKYMYAYQMHSPDSTMYNVFSMLRFEKTEVDLARLAKAVETALENHPALCTIYKYNEAGELVQQYDPQIPLAVSAEKVSSIEFEKIKDQLVQPFELINSPLHRCRLFETEDAAYLFFDAHHSICDGTSLKVFLSNIINAYNGKALEKDYYYLVLTKREQMELTEFYQESRKYFEDNYADVSWTVCPKLDNPKPQDNKLGKFFTDADIHPAELAAFEKKYMASRNEFYIAATLLAIAINTGKNDVQVSWIYNGRDDVALASSIGLLYRDLPVALRLSGDMDLRDVFAEVHQQVQDGIKYSCYPYVERNPRVVEGDVTGVLYQGDLYDLDIFGGLNVEPMDIRQNKAAAQTVLDIQILDDKDGLKYMFDYAASRYKEESMNEFCDLFKGTVAQMLQHVNTELYTFNQLKKDVCGE